MNAATTLLLSGQSAQQRIIMDKVPASGSFDIVTSLGTVTVNVPVTSSPIRDALVTLGGIYAATTCVTEVSSSARSFLITVPGGAITPFAIGANTLQDSASAAVTVTPSTVASYVDGTTNITSILAGDAYYFGNTVRLIATGVGQKLVKGSNLQLMAHWTSLEIGDMIELVCDGTNWIEVTRKYPIVDDDGFPGLIVPTKGGIFAGQATTSLVAGTLRGLRFRVPRDMQITAMKFVVVGAATADDHCETGILDASTGAIIATSGDVAGKLNSTGVKTLTLTSPVTLHKGTTYIAYHLPGTIGGTAATLRMVSIAADLSDLVATSTGSRQLFSKSGVSMPAASPITSLNNGTGAPIMFISE